MADAYTPDPLDADEGLGPRTPAPPGSDLRALEHDLVDDGDESGVQPAIARGPVRNPAFRDADADALVGAAGIEMRPFTPGERVPEFAGFDSKPVEEPVGIAAEAAAVTDGDKIVLWDEADLQSVATEGPLPDAALFDATPGDVLARMQWLEDLVDGLRQQLHEADVTNPVFALEGRVAQLTDELAEVTAQAGETALELRRRDGQLEDMTTERDQLADTLEQRRLRYAEDRAELVAEHRKAMQAVWRQRDALSQRVEGLNVEVREQITLRTAAETSAAAARAAATALAPQITELEERLAATQARLDIERGVFADTESPEDLAQAVDEAAPAEGFDAGRAMREVGEGVVDGVDQAVYIGQRAANAAKPVLAAAWAGLLQSAKSVAKDIELRDNHRNRDKR